MSLLPQECRRATSRCGCLVWECVASLFSETCRNVIPALRLSQSPAAHGLTLTQVHFQAGAVFQPVQLRRHVPDAVQTISPNPSPAFKQLTLPEHLITCEAAQLLQPSKKSPVWTCIARCNAMSGFGELARQTSAEPQSLASRRHATLHAHKATRCRKSQLSH